MGKKTGSSVNKNKEKRLARKQEQHRIADAMSYVSSANKLLAKDLTTYCKGLLAYHNNDMEVEMYIQRVTDLKKDVLEWVLDLTERNMKKLYETCSWGWNKERKVEEMTDEAAWYLIAQDKTGTQLAFSHFRFDMDHGDPVLYCYEVQVEAAGRRRGLGQQVMRVLERLAATTRMQCVRLTALTHNPAASAFFKACGYILDETSPEKEEAAHYEILSKETPFEDPSTNGVVKTDQTSIEDGMKAVNVRAT